MCSERDDASGGVLSLLVLLEHVEVDLLVGASLLKVVNRRLVQTHPGPFVKNVANLGELGRGHPTFEERRERT